MAPDVASIHVPDVGSYIKCPGSSFCTCSRVMVVAKGKPLSTNTDRIVSHL